MCVYIAIIAVFLQVMLWCIFSAPALKCKDYRLESQLAEHLDSVRERQCTLEGEAWYVSV